MSAFSSSRDASRDRAESRIVKHQHSFSESGRISVPMWDSSDPERAPPPLPLNPGTPGSPLTRSNTSARIDEAAALIAARAQESTPSSYKSNPPPSPDRHIMRAQNRRMQNLQKDAPSVGRLSDSLERRSPDKGLRTAKFVDFDDFRTSRSPERSPTRAGSDTPTPAGRKSPKDFENTPPGTSMLALQTVRAQQGQTPLGDVTNGSSPSLLPSHSFDALSSQILNLITISTNLQREMASLNKRSKDNYNDLSSLKAATSQRDEDIRNTLRDLVAGLETKFTNLDARLITGPEASRSAPNLGMYIDDKVAATGSPRPKSFELPRMGSPFSVAALNRDLTASPSIACVDGAASIALLEKVLREMATRDGQDKIMSTLEAVKSQALVPASATPVSPRAIDPDMMAKLEDILLFMKDMKEESGSKALVRSAGNSDARRPSNIDPYHENEARGGTLAKGSGNADVLNEEAMKMLKNVKQSLAQGGGLTNEVKVLVRELRGEVLGMGRELARKLEQAEKNSKAVELVDNSRQQEDVTLIVQEGLAELKEHMHHMVRESQQQIARQSQPPAVDTAAVVYAVQNALAELPRPRDESTRDPAAEREELIVAVKEAWEDCKPEIALEHFGLERDEILETLKEGLKSYQPEQPSVKDAGATYEDVLEAVRKGLADFSPPQITIPPTLSRDDILTSVRECLESFEWPAPPAAHGDLTKDDIFDAVREGMSQQSRELNTGSTEVIDAVRETMSQQEHISKEFVAEAVHAGLANYEPPRQEIEFNRDDLFDAIKACLEGENNPLGGMGERIIEAMHEFLSSMKTEFQQYSAASGKDTEQVLDALKDGLEDLRADIETYVDRAADVTGKDEIIDTVKAEFNAIRIDIDKGFASRNGGAPNTPELLDAMEKEFQHLRDTISKSMARIADASDRGEILDAIRDLSDDRSSAVSSNSEDIVRLVKEELEHMRTTLASTLVRSGSSLDRDEVLDAIREGLENSRSFPRPDGNESLLSNTSELLDAFQDGVDGIRSDIQKLTDKPVDLSTSYEILDALKNGIDDVRADISSLADRRGDGADSEGTQGQELVVHDQNRIVTEIEGLKVMITQLRIKIEALDGLAPPPVMPTDLHLHKDDMDEIYGAIDQVKESLQHNSGPVRVHSKDMDGLYTAISQVNDSVNRAREAPSAGGSLPENAASKDDVEALETLLRNIKAKMDDLTSPDAEDALAKAAQFGFMEATLSDIKTSLNDAAERAPESSHKEDFDIIELLLKDVQANVEEFKTKLESFGGEDGLLSRNEIAVVESLCHDIKTEIEKVAAPNLEGLPTKEDIADVKNDLKAFREQFEADNSLTAQAFEARKIEHGGLAAKIDDVKNVVGDLREELMTKVNDSAEGIVELNKVVGMQHDDMSKFATAEILSQMSDSIKAELEKLMEHHSTSKTEMEERDATLFTKHEDTAVDLKSTIEDKFSELMTKYDDAQLASDAKSAALEERETAHLEAMNGTKAVTDDLKLLMDTLGSTVTETCERVSEESKTVFTSVEEAHTKLDSLHSANAFEHGQTREEVSKTLAAAARLEGSLNEHHPALMAAIHEILEKVGQHYEHSQQQTESFARVTEEIKSGVDNIPAGIQPLLPALPAGPPSPTIVPEVPVERYDDTELREKLDTLLSHASLAKEVFAGLENHQSATKGSLEGISTSFVKLEQLDRLEKLDAVHEAVVSTAAEISSMVSTQARLMSEHHESRAAEATEAAIALEKRTAQKEKVEADIVTLNEEKNRLIASMAELRREQEDLQAQTKKLTRDVAKLETALQIRQEEMRDMNARAEGLERRILEGLVNHARAARSSRIPVPSKQTPAERDASMSLKRVPSSASNATTRPSHKGSVNGSTIGSAVGMALQKRAPLGTKLNAVSHTPRSSVDRRILSTSHVTGNRGKTAVETALVLAPVPKPTGLINLKRSQSVKSNPSSYAGGRKASWNGTTSQVTSSSVDKENYTHTHSELDDDDGSSDASTERRDSRVSDGTSLMYTDSMVYGTGSSISRRSTSYASSMVGTINGQAHSIAEEGEEDDNDNETDGSVYDDADGEALSPETAVVLHDGHASADAENAGMALDDDTTVAKPGVNMHVDIDGLSDLQPPPLITDAGVKFHGSDSGLGTEPPTDHSDLGSVGRRQGSGAGVGEAAEYYAMSAQDAVAT